jgi:hypothetical protein
LKLVSRGLYAVVRENELADGNKVDISALVEGLARVPIEVKPLGPYSLNQLTACISDQLHAKYMRPRDVKFGTLLLVRQVDKEWDIGGRLVPFETLVEAVRSFATEFNAKHDTVITVEIIDLLAPA